MYLRNMKNYQSMNLVYTTPEGTEIWLGDYYAATDLNLLKQKRISSVLTAAAQLGIKYPKEANISHKVLNAFDIPTYKMTPHFDQAFDFIKKSLSNGNILVHCAAGISRSTTCVLVYLMRQRGYGFKQSLQMVRAKRAIVNPNYGFQNQLAKYDQVLKKNRGENKNEQEKVFSKKQDKTVEEIQAQKNAFFKFMSKETGTLNKTLGANNSKYKGTSSGSKKVAEQPLVGTKKQVEERPGMRGQSLNYKKGPIGNGITMYSNTNKINNLTFKLEQPKIVNYKR